MLHQAPVCWWHRPGRPQHRVEGAWASRSPATGSRHLQRRPDHQPNTIQHIRWDPPPGVPQDHPSWVMGSAAADASVSCDNEDAVQHVRSGLDLGRHITARINRRVPPLRASEVSDALAVLLWNLTQIL